MDQKFEQKFENLEQANFFSFLLNLSRSLRSLSTAFAINGIKKMIKIFNI